MPVITVQIARRAEPVTREQKQALAAGLTEVVVRVLGKRPESVQLILQEVDADHWAEGGVLVDELRQRRAAAAAAPPAPADAPRRGR